MNPMVIDTLRQLSKVRLIDNPFVFPGSKKGERLKDLPKYWEEYLAQADVQDFTWHDLRNTFASRLVMAGVDLYTVSRLLGHKDIKVTMRYAHLAPGYLKKAVNMLCSTSPLLPQVQSGTL
jgi:site-specific recombinase XerD